MKNLVPQSELTFKFSRSSGPGGQNVNKVHSRVTLTWNIEESQICNAAVKRRFQDRYKRFMVGDLVVISSQANRSQKMNIDDCIDKLEHYLRSVLLPPKVRKKTKPTKASKKKRLDAKSKQSKLKKLRSEKF